MPHFFKKKRSNYGSLATYEKAIHAAIAKQYRSELINLPELTMIVRKHELRRLVDTDA